VVLRFGTLIQRKKLFAFFDAAYQGFASGDPVADSYGARAFADAGLEFAVAQSYSKIAGLYGE
jgi:aspartate/tyrosine/aromatic aminotransferase